MKIEDELSFRPVPFNDAHFEIDFNPFVYTINPLQEYFLLKLFQVFQHGFKISEQRLSILAVHDPVNKFQNFGPTCVNLMTLEVIKSWIYYGWSKALNLVTGSAILSLII
jgi:hypothetical protein